MTWEGGRTSLWGAATVATARAAAATAATNSTSPGLRIVRLPSGGGRLGSLLDDLEQGGLGFGGADLAERGDGGPGQPGVLALGELEQSADRLVALGPAEGDERLHLDLG